MRDTRKRTWLRSVVAIPAAALLFVLMSTPADAALPFNSTFTATVTGGNITVGSNSFPLGPGGLQNCNPGGASSTVTGSISAGGAMSSFDFTFRPGTQNVPLLGITCLTLSVTNEATLTGTLTDVAGPNATVTVSSATVRVDIDNGLVGSNCRIEPINTGGLSGTMTDAGPPNTSTLATGTFNVPTSTGCGFFGGPAVNAFLGLPTTGTATLNLSVAWP